MINRVLIVALVAFAIGASKSSSARSEGAGTVLTGLTVPSVQLGHDFTYALYLPQRSNPDEPLPVLYLLHGRDDTETAWLEKGRIAVTLDRMIAAGKLRPMAVVMPMAGNSWYVDDARGTRGYGPYATAFAENLIPEIERKHHLASCRNARAIAGLSMGGFGAILYALTRPQLFNATISLSGSLFSDQTTEIEARKAFYDRVLSGIYGEPFDPEIFRSWTVFARLEKANTKAMSLGVWLAAGDGDFAGILNGTVRLHQELRRRKIESHLRVYGGEHTWELWSMAIEPALTWLSPRLTANCTAN